MFGNNIQTSKIRRILVPLFTQDNPTIQNGLKYFFPDDPEIDNKNIVGVEAHLVTTPGFIDGDIAAGEFNIIPQAEGGNVYLNFYSNKNEEIFANMPLRSLFTNGLFGTGITKRIKPLFGKIKTRSCFAYVPGNAPGFLTNRNYLYISFFYNN